MIRFTSAAECRAYSRMLLISERFVWFVAVWLRHFQKQMLCLLVRCNKLRDLEDQMWCFDRCNTFRDFDNQMLCFDRCNTSLQQAAGFSLTRCGACRSALQCSVIFRKIRYCAHCVATRCDISKLSWMCWDCFGCKHAAGFRNHQLPLRRSVLLYGDMGITLPFDALLPRAGFHTHIPWYAFLRL